jgi:hypothetical protein
VRVDQPRRKNSIRPVDALLRLIIFIDLGARTHPDDVITGHRDCAVLNHAMSRIHRNDEARRPDRIDLRGAQPARA